MTLALRNPDLVGSLVSVDNAPVDAALKSDFAKYIQGMCRVEKAHVSRQSEADEILKDYEEVSLTFLENPPSKHTHTHTQTNSRAPLSLSKKSLFQSANSCSRTSSAPRTLPLT